MKILITGANGFVGSNLINSLKSDYDIFALVRNNSDINLISDEINIIRTDYSEKDLKKIFSKVDIIIHLAGVTKGRNWEIFHKINMDLTNKISRIANESKNIKQLIFISSQAAAGMSKNEIPKNEHDNNLPVTFYGKSKLLAEQIIILQVLNLCNLKLKMDIILPLFLQNLLAMTKL